MSFGYSVGQLLKYHRHCATAAPESELLPPGGRAGWDNMSVASWLEWFTDCLTAKINRTLNLSSGKGNRAKKRADALADARKECKWCGQKTGKRNQDFCCVDCRVSYSY